MNRFEQLVPPLELCKQIPGGAFADSALVWVGDQFCEHIKVLPREYNGIMRDVDLAPAPTLAEILEALDAMFDAGYVRVWNVGVHGEWGVKLVNFGKRYVDSVEYDNNPAIAALKLWLNQNGEEI